MDDVREQVRQRYALAAVQTSNEGCCGGSCGATAEVDESFGAALYDATEVAGLPVEAVAASLGCGNPLTVAELAAGERVLDLGSGGGIDVLLSARRVGPTGFAYGVDMTDEMLELARANADRAPARRTSSSARARSRTCRSPTARSTWSSPTASSTSRRTSPPCSARCSGCWPTAVGSASPTSSPRTT